MDDKRQKNQLVLAFMEESRSEAPTASVEGTESSAGKRGTESSAMTEQLMEEVCERENCKQALARVKANKGSAGIDGMTVAQLPEHLKQHWPVIREQLLNGNYKPQPVKRVEPVFSGPKEKPKQVKDEKVKRLVMGAAWVAGVSYSIGVVGDLLGKGSGRP